MSKSDRLRQFFKLRLPLILGIYIIIQPVLDALTCFGALAEHPVTAGVAVRTLFMVLAFLYVVFVSHFEGKKGCMIYLGAIIAYLALFMVYMLSVGGLSLCLANVKELMKVFFAPIVMAFLYAVYREHGHLISTRTLAVSGGIYAGVILFAFLTGTSFTSYGNSGHGFKGWFYAANEVSCIIAITAPVVLYFCLRSLVCSGRKQWWKVALTLFALASVAFSANFIGTKIVFAITLLYAVIAFLWALVRAIREKDRQTRDLAIAFGVVAAAIFALYFVSPLQTYLKDVWIGMMDETSEIRAVSYGEEIQKASEGTWMRELLKENYVMMRLDQILSRRLFSASPSLQVWLDSGVAGKLLGIGYADTAAYARSIEFMVEMDPLGIFIRHGLLGFLVYYVPYLAGILWVIVRFFRKPLQRLADLKYCSYLYAALMAFAISAIAGHALVSPAVSTYILVVSFRLWVMTREQDGTAHGSKAAS